MSLCSRHSFPNQPLSIAQCFSSRCMSISRVANCAIHLIASLAVNLAVSLASSLEGETFTSGANEIPLAILVSALMGSSLGCVGTGQIAKVLCRKIGV